MSQVVMVPEDTLTCCDTGMKAARSLFSVLKRTVPWSTLNSLLILIGFFSVLLKLWLGRCHSSLKHNILANLGQVIHQTVAPGCRCKREHWLGEAYVLGGMLA